MFNNATSKALAIQKAKSVLDAYKAPGCSNADLLKKIIEENSIQYLQWEHFHKTICGMLISYRDNFYIVVNKLHSQTRRLFTIAHELGHYFLHTEPNKEYQLYLEQPSKHSTESTECTQANIFAANLLMPRDQVYDLFYNNYPIEDMADHFQVSYSAMLLRLRKLKLLPQEQKLKAHLLRKQLISKLYT